MVSVDNREQNKLMVTEYLALIGTRKVREAVDRYVAASYVQHNPRIANGPEAVVAAIAPALERNPQVEFSIVQMAAEGDMVWVHSRWRLSPGAPSMSVVDIWRVADGKLVEHWDVIQPPSDNP
jgi:predicted SnoaL-like aldol condensation-catalyzing enzyme